MDALLLAAGFGTRLRPLTEQVAKPLLPIYGVPLLDIHLAHLLAYKGTDPISRIVVNGHHLAGQVRRHLAAHAARKQIAFSHETEILGTGGAVANAAPHLTSDPFLVLNCDVLLAPPIEEAIAFHGTHDHLATMVLVRSPVQPNVETDGDRVTAILRGQTVPGASTFTGFHVVSQGLLGILPRGVFHDIRDTYDELLVEGKLGAYLCGKDAASAFLDIGTPEAYLEAHRICTRDGCRSFGFSPEESKITHIMGFGFADRTAALEKGCRIEESIVLGNASVAAGIRIRHSIIGPGASVTSDVSDRLVTTVGVRDIAR